MRSLSLAVLLLMVPAPAPAQAPEASLTPWGAPDLSGYWEYRSTTPLERPEALAGREVLTPEEEADYLVGRHAAIGRERDLQLNADWWQPAGLTDGRTSLIVDPPDGRLPARTAAGRERARTLGVGIRARSADGPEDRERYERCIMGRTVPLMAVSPNRLAQIFQTPGVVAILHEQNSDLRIIPLDGSAAAARRGPPVAGQLARPLGGRHPRRRDVRVQRRVDDPGRRAERALRRAHPVCRPRPAALRVHGARPRVVRGPVDGDVPHHPRRRPRLRERVPRGQLQHAPSSFAAPAPRNAAGGNRPGCRRRGATE